MNYHQLSQKNSLQSKQVSEKTNETTQKKASLHHAGEALQLGEVAVVVPPASLKFFGLAVEIPWDMLG